MQITLKKLDKKDQEIPKILISSPTPPDIIFINPDWKLCVKSDNCLLWKKHNHLTKRLVVIIMLVLIKMVVILIVFMMVIIVVIMLSKVPPTLLSHGGVYNLILLVMLVAMAAITAGMDIENLPKHKEQTLLGVLICCRCIIFKELAIVSP